MAAIAAGLRRILASRRAVTAVEYGLMVGIIAVFAFAGLQAAGASLNAVFLGYVAGP